MTKQQSLKIENHLRTLVGVTDVPGLIIHHAVFPVFGPDGAVREDGRAPRAVIRDSAIVKLPASVREVVKSVGCACTFEVVVHGSSISHIADDFNASSPVIGEWVVQCKRLKSRLDQVEKAYMAHLNSLDEAAKFAEALGGPGLT